MLVVFVSFCFLSCKKFVEVPAPYTSLNGGNVFLTDATAIAAVTALYTQSAYADGQVTTNTIQAVNYSTALSSDELTLFPGTSGILLELYKK